MAEVKDYFTDAGTLDRQEFGNLFASSIHLHDDTACGRATLLQCLDTRYWPSPMAIPSSGTKSFACFMKFFLFAAGFVCEM